MEAAKRARERFVLNGLRPLSAMWLGIFCLHEIPSAHGGNAANHAIINDGCLLPFRLLWVSSAEPLRQVYWHVSAVQVSRIRRPCSCGARVITRSRLRTVFGQLTVR